MSARADRSVAPSSMPPSPIPTTATHSRAPRRCSSRSRRRSSIQGESSPSRKLRLVTWSAARAGAHARAHCCCAAADSARCNAAAATSTMSIHTSSPSSNCGRLPPGNRSAPTTRRNFDKSVLNVASAPAGAPSHSQRVDQSVAAHAPQPIDAQAGKQRAPLAAGQLVLNTAAPKPNHEIQPHTGFQTVFEELKVSSTTAA